MTKRPHLGAAQEASAPPLLAAPILSGTAPPTPSVDAPPSSPTYMCHHGRSHAATPGYCPPTLLEGHTEAPGGEGGRVTGREENDTRPPPPTPQDLPTVTGMLAGTALPRWDSSRDAARCQRDAGLLMCKAIDRIRNCGQPRQGRCSGPGAARALVRTPVRRPAHVVLAAAGVCLPSGAYRTSTASVRPGENVRATRGGDEDKADLDASGSTYVGCGTCAALV